MSRRVKAFRHESVKQSKLTLKLHNWGARRFPLSYTLVGPLLVILGLWAGWELVRQSQAEKALAGSSGNPEMADGIPPQAPAPRFIEAVPPGEGPEGMVWVPGGVYWQGDSDAMFADAQPVRQVAVDGFWMDRTEVTNRQFAEFVEATGYVTLAEIPPKAEDYPGATPEQLVAGSIVFTPPKESVGLDNHLQWWRYVHGASWRHPEGPGSNITGREDHPVVHISWIDAAKYAEWAGKRLPTEAEWERAARGGLERKSFAWGDERPGQGGWQANIWQGKFPRQNSLDDGFFHTAPVGSFKPNRYGLHDMAGNVWEWCSDWYHVQSYSMQERLNPKGPARSFDPQEPGVPKRVQRGGSFLCSDIYCVRYRPGARGKGAVDSGASHVGFRCVLSPK